MAASRTANTRPVLRDAGAIEARIGQQPALPVPDGLAHRALDGYADWLAELKARIHAAQQRAALAVNRELVLLYWQIGQDILERQASEGWGAKVIDRLSHDLRAVFPRMQGFSPRNLKYMRAFARAWPDAAFVQEVLAQRCRLQACLPWLSAAAGAARRPGGSSRR